jgi:chaperone BCS1
MLDQLWAFLLTQLQNNQFLAGGAVLGVLAGVFHYLRAIPGKGWRWVKSQFIIEVEVLDRDEAFNWINKWLAKHPYGAKRARMLTVKTERVSDDEDQNRSTPSTADDRQGPPQIMFSPSIGEHWFFYKGRLVILERNRKDDEAKGMGVASHALRESFLIKVFTRNRTFAKQLLEEARDLFYPPGAKRVAVMVPRYGEWRTMSKRRVRSIDSVILRTGVMDRLVNAVAKFRGTEQQYVERGIPYRLGVLLMGPPGGGKSSTVAAIASHFGMDIAIFNPNTSGVSDDELCVLFADLPKNTILLIEDIDCTWDGRTGTVDKESKISFSGLLNAIDGVAAAEGRILFMTTNHPEKLDSALIRPGRADIRELIDSPDAGQASRMFERFYPQATSQQNLRFIEALPVHNVSMASLQALLTAYGDDPEDAIKHALEAEVKPEKALATVAVAA